MLLVNIIGKLSDLDRVIATCCGKKYFHPERAIGHLPVKSGYTQLVEENPYAKYLDKFTDLSKRMMIEFESVDIDENSMTHELISEYTDTVAHRLDELTIERKELAQSIENDVSATEQLIHFKGFDLNLDEIFKSRFVKVRFGRIPNDSFNKLAQYEDNPYIMFVPCECDENYHWGVYFSPLDEVPEVDRIFSNLFFERLRIPSAAGTPEQAVVQMTAHIEECKKNLGKIENEINEIWKNEKHKLSHAYFHIKHHFMLFSMRSYAAKYNDYFHMIGFIPARYRQDFEERLSDYDSVEFSVEKTGRNSKIEPPVLLKNSKITRPFEMFIKMYGLPGYNEIDPTFFVALTYSVIFGIMFADIGQGLLLAIVGCIAAKKNPLGSILMRCGFFSVIFGALFGSVFGFEDLLDNFYHNTLGISFLPFKPMHGANITTILLGAVAIGIVLVITAIILSIYVALKQKKYEQAFFGQSSLTGLVFYTAIIFTVADKLVLKTGISNIWFVLALIGLPVMIMFFREPLGRLAAHKKNWQPESWGEFIVQNIFEMIEILLSYITNTLSFLRVGAFVLVHAGMMMVVFILAGEGLVRQLIVFAIGNVFVIGMEGLLVGIQSLRLEFYEMFSRFFEGSGHPYKPIN